VGGGIIGLSLSLSLRKRGVKVLVVERGEPGREASHAAAGMLADHGDEFPSQLADSLQRNGCYEVVNAAVTGLTLTGQVQLWQNWVSRFRPTVVVIYASPTFYLSADPPEFAPRRTASTTSAPTSQPASANFSSIQLSSRLLARMRDRVDFPSFIQRRRVMKRIAKAIEGRPEDWIYRSVPEDRVMLFRQHLDSLVGEIRATGAIPILVTHAMRFGQRLDAEDRDLLQSWRQFTPRASENVLMSFEMQTAGIVRDLARVRGVLFTGSTRAAQSIDRALAQRPEREPIPLVAETGGQNAMIVDSSALPEQVVRDVLNSAFDSAGQRCSALRLLCVQDDVAPRILPMLRGAAAQLRVGDPARLETDVGPVIDAHAAQAIHEHLERMLRRHRIERVPLTPECAHGTFVAPAIVEIDAVEELQREVFGPVLHLLRFERDRLPDLVEAINATGYALTFGIHSRIDETIRLVAGRIRAGNIYVNRNMIGAVVGVQPFGGEGLSGTGPKAGGPWMLPRLRTGTDAQALAPASVTAIEAPPPELELLASWAIDNRHDELAQICRHYQSATPIGCQHELPGPTGETNVLDYRPRRRVLCRASDRSACLLQIAAVVATSNRALLDESPWARALADELPAPVRACIERVERWEQAQFELVLLDGACDDGAHLRQQLSQRDGPRIRVLQGGPEYGLQWMVAERLVSTNTAAAGGNASLLTLD